METLFTNANLLLNGKFVHTDFAVSNGRITKIQNNLGNGVDIKNNRVIPGLFDVHTHGANGYDFNTADSKEKMQTIVDYYLSHGATTVLATIMTDSDEVIKRQLKLLAEFMRDHSSIYGIHLEGPFLSPSYKGAMPEKMLQIPTVEKFLEYQEIAQGNIKYITIAPELENAVEFTREVSKTGVVVSLGHSGANFNQALACVEAGAKCFTHTFNAMRPIEHHDPSIVVAALYSNAYAEAILDGKHLNRNIVKMLEKVKGSDKLIGITDSLMAAGLPNGEYSLAGTPITVIDGDARLSGTNTRAGSTLDIFSGLTNLMEFCGESIEKAILPLTLTPATLLNIDKDYGSLDVNKVANFLVIDDDNNLIDTYLDGKKVN